MNVRELEQKLHAALALSFSTKANEVGKTLLRVQDWAVLLLSAGTS